MDAFSKVLRIYKHVCETNDEPRERPGLSRRDILDSFAKIGVAPSEPILQLYEWHDGIDNLNAFLYFLPLEDVNRLYLSHKKFKEKSEEFKWHVGLVPLLTLNGDVDICVDFRSGEVVSIDPEGGTERSIAKHYENYLGALLEGFDADAFEFDETAGAFEVKEDRWRPIALRHGVEDAW